MCDFAPGDELECVDDSECFGVVVKGGVYICKKVIPQIDDFACTTCGRTDTAEVVLVDRRPVVGWAFCECQFRRVQRRNLQSWLKTSVPNTDHLDKPLPAKKRERV